MGQQFEDVLALAAGVLECGDVGETDDPADLVAAGLAERGAADCEAATVGDGELGVGGLARQVEGPGFGREAGDQLGHRTARRVVAEQGLGLAVGDQHLAGQIGDQGRVGQALQGVEHLAAQVAGPVDGRVHQRHLAVDDVGGRAAAALGQGREQVGLLREGAQFLQHVGAGRLKPPPAP